MITKDIRDSLKQTISELKIAERELNRPNEDVVTLLVCITTRQSMNSLMRLFLLSKAINHNEGKSLDNLFKQCKVIDQQFNSIELEKIFCNKLNHTECENKYCLSTQHVTNCFDVANKLRILILNKLNLTESEIA